MSVFMAFPGHTHLFGFSMVIACRNEYVFMEFDIYQGNNNRLPKYVIDSLLCKVFVT